MGPTTGLDVLEERKISWPSWDPYPGSSSQKPHYYTESTTAAPLHRSNKSSN